MIFVGIQWNSPKQSEHNKILIFRESDKRRSQKSTSVKKRCSLKLYSLIINFPIEWSLPPQHQRARLPSTAPAARPAGRASRQRSHARSKAHPPPRGVRGSRPMFATFPNSVPQNSSPEPEHLFLDPNS